MKIFKTVEFSKEIEIEIDTDDISVIYSDNPDVPEWLGQMNSIASFIKGTPMELVEQLSQKQVDILSQFLIDQGNKLKDMFASINKSKD